MPIISGSDIDAVELRQLLTLYERLLGEYCQRRGDSSLHDRLVRDVMPRMTMKQEAVECAGPYLRAYPERRVTFEEPRAPHYEEWKRANCWRWYHFDHEQDAKRTLAERLAHDPECTPYRAPSLRQTFRMDVALPAGVRPTTMAWRGYQPPPLLGMGLDDIGRTVLVAGAVAGAVTALMIWALRG